MSVPTAYRRESAPVFAILGGTDEAQMCSHIYAALRVRSCTGHSLALSGSLERNHQCLVGNMTLGGRTHLSYCTVAYKWSTIGLSH
jgi:hypothetical protein